MFDSFMDQSEDEYIFNPEYETKDGDDDVLEEVMD
jgi:hypothetical protein